MQRSTLADCSMSSQRSDTDPMRADDGRT